ncbi:MAG TPA: hypothetical protein VM912_02110 [Terriglobales bacterium]|nr:hypothetical protein [Terriglobales bacterium]
MVSSQQEPEQSGSRTKKRVGTVLVIDDRAGFPLAPIVILSELPWMPDDANRYANAFVHKGEHDHLFETIAKFCGEST